MMMMNNDTYALPVASFQLPVASCQSPVASRQRSRNLQKSAEQWKEKEKRGKKQSDHKLKPKPSALIPAAQDPSIVLRTI